MTLGNSDIVTVDLKNRSYNIHIGQGVLDDLARLVPFDLKNRRLFVVTDTNIHTTHAAAVTRSLPGAEMMALPPGEQTKSFEKLGSVLSWILDGKADRRSVVIAVGGGVIGDLAGLAASLMMRGVPYIQVPTTLLAMVDSAVGGKTAIDMPQGKNLVGTFHQPSCVITDTDVLGTLPDREMRAGYAEIVKYGLINDIEFFEWLEINSGKILGKDPAALRHAIKMSCEKKAMIVAADETEQSGLRALLNLGHTFGHALESVAAYDGDVLLHGEAVSIGMVLAFQLSVRRGHCDQSDLDRARAHLAACGLPVCIKQVNFSKAPSVADIVAHMAHDKKAESGKPHFIVVDGIGRARVDSSVDMNDVVAVLENSAKG